MRCNSYAIVSLAYNRFMGARWSALAVLASMPFALAAKDKTLSPGRAENAAVVITAEAFLDRAAIKELIGSDLNGYYTVLQVTVTPKTGKLNLQHDDFLLRTDHDGERTHPLAASEIAGHTDMVVRAVGTGTVGTENTGPVWGGMPGTGGMPMQLPGNGQMAGNGAGGTVMASKINKDAAGKQDPMYAVLKEKILPEKEIDKPVTGLLIFTLEKQKLKDLELIYTTAEGPLKLRFR